MNEAFFLYFRRVWGSSLPIQLTRAILVAALFELLVYIINTRIRKALTPALGRDAQADSAQRIERRRIVLGIPMLLTRAILYCIAILIILRIFHYRNELDVYPVALGVLVLVAVGGRQVLRDAISGYFIHYDYLFAVGDEITVGDQSGMVSEIGLRHTTLRTRDGQEIVIRNSEIRSLLNRTGLQRRAEQQAPPGEGTP